jgi:hypothetical protein
MDPAWLKWAKELAAISQNGLAFSEIPYDIERYQMVRRIAAEIMSAHSNLDTETLMTTFAEQEGYATPKVDVRGVVFRDDKILLVEEKIDGGWTLPGGWADPCQSPSECVVREIREAPGGLRPQQTSPQACHAVPHL